MEQNTETLTRKELYDMVWSTSLVTLAKKYQLSDNGLRKLCIRMSIPLPSVGHWSKIQFGKKTTIKPLSTNYNGEAIVTLYLRTESTDKSNVENPLKRLKEEIKFDSHISFEVPKLLHSKNPLILAAKERLTGKNAIQSYRHKGIISCGRGELDIRVSTGNVSRSLRFMDTLIKLLNARGHVITFRNECTYAVVKKQEIQIILRETLKKVEVKGAHYNTTEYHPTGILSFKMEGYGGKEWKDGKQSLETFLPDILARLELKSDELTAWQLESEKQSEIWAEQARIKKELQQRKENELASFKIMLEKAERWHKAVNLRAYIAEVEVRYKGLPDKEQMQWLEWARKKADWYDPFVEAPDDMLSDINRKTLKMNTGWD